MLYLLDADTLITSDRDYYPLDQFSKLWEWIEWQGSQGNIKIPYEQYEEVTNGSKDDRLVAWLKASERKKNLLFEEELSPEVVRTVTKQAYGQLDEIGVEKVGRDPFLISYAYQKQDQRCIVSFEESRPKRTR